MDDGDGTLVLAVFTAVDLARLRLSEALFMQVSDAEEEVDEEDEPFVGEGGGNI